MYGSLNISEVRLSPVPVHFKAFPASGPTIHVAGGGGGGDGGGGGGGGEDGGEDGAGEGSVGEGGE